MPHQIDIGNETSPAEIRNGRTVVNSVTPVRVTPEQLAYAKQPAGKGILLKAILSNGPKIYIGGPLRATAVEGLEMGAGSFVSIPASAIDEIYAISDREPVGDETCELRWLAL
jgi:hypothetical protein